MNHRHHAAVQPVSDSLLTALPEPSPLAVLKGGEFQTSRSLSRLPGATITGDTTGEASRHSISAVRPARLALMAGALLLAGIHSASQAAGGHFAVDDAALLDPGQCQVEAWQERGDAHRFRIDHVGPGCRLGALEWGLNLDRYRLSEGSRGTAFGPQLKWAMPVSESFSLGLSAASYWDRSRTHGTHFAGTSLVVPLTWQALSSVAVHVNLGQDLHPGESNTARRGLALEWTPSAQWSTQIERFDDNGERRLRAGLRYSLTPALSFDLSRARHLGSDSRPWWAAGVNWAFDR